MVNYRTPWIFTHPGSELWQKLHLKIFLKTYYFTIITQEKPATNYRTAEPKYDPAKIDRA